MRDTYHISELCQALQVSKSGYYAARGRRPAGSSPQTLPAQNHPP